jgi:glycerol-3-phosphate dehydrogenase (NAD(P)+)
MRNWIDIMNKIAVIGVGSWGTAITLTLSKKGYPISLWAWDPDQAATINKTRINPFMPGHKIPQNVNATNSIPDALRGAGLVVFVTISDSASTVAKDLQPHLPAGIPIVSATKGLNNRTGLTISQTLKSVLGNKNPIVVLSGPNLAVEVANGVPTATVAASEDESTAHMVQSIFMCPTLRVYTNTDVLGVELAGALKNVIAIGAGISDGLGYGDNTKAALLTRGLAEITRLGLRLGARESTFRGLAGIGDLMVTCASPLSRNHRLGIGLGEGRQVDDILKELGQVAEGIPSTQAAYHLSKEHHIPMPISEAVYNVLFNGKRPAEAVVELMTREPKEEVW